jgi:uncharacterized protein (DUF1697 family)
MKRYVAFLRGINVGNRRVAMARLVGIFSALGHSDVTTFIASGNVIFSSRLKNIGSLEAEATAALERDLGFQVATMIRAAEEVVAITQSAIFPDEDIGACNLHVGLMQGQMPTEEARKLEAVQTATDRFHVIGREFYWLCRTGISESTVWKLPEARAVQLPANTLRNMKTMRRLVEKHLTIT